MSVRSAAVCLLIAGLLLQTPGINADAQGPKIEVISQLAHSDPVHSVAFSSDGRRVVSGSQDHTLKLWDVASGKLIRTFEGHEEGVSAVAFSRDGARLLSGGYDHTVKLWDAATGRLIRTIKEHVEGVYSVAFSPDGTRMLSGANDSTLKLWDSNTGQLIRTLKGDPGSMSANSVAFSPDGTHLISSSEEKKLKLWNGKTGQLIRTFNRDADDVAAVAFTPDGKRVLSFGLNSDLTLWDVKTGQVLLTIQAHAKDIMAVALSSDGTRLLSGGWDTLELIDAATGQVIRTFAGHAGTGSRNSVAFSPDGTLVLSGTKLWDAGSGQLVRTFDREAGRVYSVAIAPDSAHVLSGGDDKTLKIWDAETGQLIRIIAGHEETVKSVAFSPDGTRLLSGSVDSTFKLWDSAGQLIRDFEPEGGGVNSVAFSRDGMRLLTSGRVELWDSNTGQLIRSFEGFLGALSPDGARVLTSWGEGIEGTLKLWDANTGQLLRTFQEYAQALTFSPDGTRLLWVNMYGNTPKLWNAATGQLIRTFKGHTDFVISVAFAPNGMQLLSGSWDKTLKLWDVNTGQLIRTFKGHLGRIQSVAFSRDGQRVVSGSEDTSVRVWDVASGRDIATFIGGLGGEWLVTTPAGFFAGTRDANKLLSIVRGLEVTSIDQVHQSLFNPDLVREALAGDPSGEVKRAAQVVSLEKVIESGPAPAVAITSPPDNSRAASDLVAVAARIIDRGKGVGRIEWRVNGVTAAVSKAAAKAGSDIEINQELALDPGDNIIEVVVYNASNLLASVPARIAVIHDGPVDSRKPTLHVVAIGIDAYRSKLFSRLNFAAKDARAFGEALTLAASGLYDSVRVTHAIDDEATLAKLDTAFEKLKGEVHPRDTFIFFASAHGYSQNGRFYLIPSDYPDNLDEMGTRAISQERLQDWIANRIKARKAMLLLDTCESGALVAGHTQSRINQPASEAAIGRLHEATGRPVLTAAASGKAAWEGYKGHGVFTWALLDALRNGDTNGNGTIELFELAAHVQNLVPKLGAELGSAARGWAVVGPTTAPPSPAATSRPTAQAARFGSRGEDFTISRRLH